MAETNQERAERVLGMEPGSVERVGTKQHFNGIEFCALLADGSFQTRTVGMQLWEPPPMRVSVKRAVVGEQVVGKRVIGREQAGQDGDGKPLFRDVTEDVMGPAPETDQALTQRATAEAEAKAKAAGWRRPVVDHVDLATNVATVTVSCG